MRNPARANAIGYDLHVQRIRRVQQSDIAAKTPSEQAHGIPMQSKTGNPSYALNLDEQAVAGSALDTNAVRLYSLC